MRQLSPHAPAEVWGVLCVLFVRFIAVPASSGRDRSYKWIGEAGPMRHLVLAIPLLLIGCSVTRPLSLPTPAGTENRPSVYPALRVTDSAGRARWVYNARVEGDSIWGSRHPGASRPRIAVPLAEVRTLATPHFHVGRTVGLIGGLAGVVVAAALLAPDPVYAIEYP